MRGLSLIVATVGAVLVSGTASAAEQIELPPGQGRDLVYGQCRTCHDLQYLKESAGITRDDWDQMLISMRQYGLRLTDDQRKEILDYLGTYLGPNPPKTAAETGAPAQPESSRPTTISGEAVFKEQCIACHQATGQGVAGQFPPLASNRDLFLGKQFAPKVVLFGMQGPIVVNGEHFNGAMPSFDFLSNAQIAAVLDYVRSAWGNSGLAPKDTKPIDAATVADLRKVKLEPAKVLALRRDLKASR